MRKTLVIAAASVLVATAATATATTLITSAQIKNGSIRAVDIQQGSITSDRLSPAMRRKLDRIGTLSTGSNGSAGIPGARGETGFTGATGATGARGNSGKDGLNGTNGTNGANAVQALTVTSDNKHGFYFGSMDKTEVENTGEASASIETVAGATLGTKALHLDVNGGNSFATFRKTYAAGQLPALSSVSFAGFDYMVATDSLKTDAPQMKFTVVGARTGTASGFATLVFEPTTNYGNQPLGTWRSVNTRYGTWRSTKVIPGTTGGYGTLDSILTANPDAVITKFQVEVGSSGLTDAVGFKGAVDNIRLGFDGAVTRYDIGG